MPKMTDKQRKEVGAARARVAELIEGPARTAAEQTEAHRGYEARKRAEKERQVLVERIAELEKQRSAREEIRRADKVVPALQRKGRLLGTDKREAAAFACISDCHIEERVDPLKVNGLNEFNPSIAERRMRRCFEGISWLIREQQSMFTIKRLVLNLNGDIITGYIHEELLESNFMSPTKAVVFGKRLLVAGLRLLLEDDSDLEILVVCKCGNHGRTTPKLRVGTAVDNSFEWLLYEELSAEFANEPRVKWQIDGGHHSITDVFGMRLHTHHGDSVRSSGGIGGITVPLNRAVIQWHAKFNAHVSVVGHFHQYLPGQKLIVNGSLIGYGAYSDWLPSAAPEPAQQAFFLVDSKRGLCQQTPIWVQE